MNPETFPKIQAASEGDGVIRVIVIVAFVLFWIIGQVVTSLKKKPTRVDPEFGSVTEAEFEAINQTRAERSREEVGQRQNEPMRESTRESMSGPMRESSRMETRGEPSRESSRGTVVTTPQAYRRQDQSAAKQAKLDRTSREKAAKVREKTARRVPAVDTVLVGRTTQKAKVVSEFQDRAVAEEAAHMKAYAIKEAVHARTDAQKVSAALRVRALMMGQSARDAIFLAEVLNKPVSMRE